VPYREKKGSATFTTREKEDIQLIEGRQPNSQRDNSGGKKEEKKPTDRIEKGKEPGIYSCGKRRPVTTHQAKEKGMIPLNKCRSQNDRGGGGAMVEGREKKEKETLVT